MRRCLVVASSKRERDSLTSLAVSREYRAFSAPSDRENLCQLTWRRIQNLELSDDVACVLVVSVDQVRGGEDDLHRAIAALHSRNVDLVSADPWTSWLSDVGAVIRLYRAQYERRHSDRIKEGQERAAAQERGPGAPRVKCDMSRIVQLRAEGLSVREIAVALGQEGSTKISPATVARRLKEHAAQVALDSKAERA